MSSRLLHQAPVPRGRSRERLAKWNTMFDNIDLHSVSVAEPVGDQLGVCLPGAPQHHLIGVGILFHTHRGIFGRQP